MLIYLTLFVEPLDQHLRAELLGQTLAQLRRKVCVRLDVLEIERRRDQCLPEGSQDAGDGTSGRRDGEGAWPALTAPRLSSPTAAGSGSKSSRGR